MTNSAEAKMAETMIKNLKEKSGRTLSQWLTLVKKSKLEKHGLIVKMLKLDHGMTHGFANMVAHHHLKSAAYTSGKAADELVGNQYAGDKIKLKPIYDALILAVDKFGKDVEISAKKKYVSVRRKKQFAIIQPSTKDRVDVGINLPNAEETLRLEISGSFNSMVSHRVRLTSKKDVNSQLKRWLKQAYDAS